MSAHNKHPPRKHAQPPQPQYNTSTPQTTNTLKRPLNHGSGSVEAIAIITAIIIIAAACITGCSVYAHKTRLQGIADVTALAAGTRAAVSAYSPSGSERACRIVDEVATRNSATVVECFIHNANVCVHLRRNYDVAAITGGIHAYACAGAATPVEVDAISAHTQTKREVSDKENKN